MTGKIVGAMTGDAGQIKRGQYHAAWGKDTADLGEYDYYLRGHDVFMNSSRRRTTTALDGYGKKGWQNIQTRTCSR